MKRLIILILLVGAASGQAQSGGGYDLTWNTIEGGGATFSTGGAYSLGGTIGQADAGSMSGGTYQLAGGQRPPPCHSSPSGRAPKTGSEHEARGQSRALFVVPRNFSHLGWATHSAMTMASSTGTSR